MEPGTTEPDRNVNLPRVVSRDEWLAARVELLAEEKALTRARDAVNTRRRSLPMVRIDKEYLFTGPHGEARLPDLFEGRRQLIVYHFMFDPGWDAGCRSCSLTVDGIGHLAHLHARDTTLALVSRAPFGAIEAYRARMGWQIPWYSSYGGDFNHDFHVTLDESVAPIFYNYRTRAEHERAGAPWYTGAELREIHGVSVFLRDRRDGAVFHTYSTYARGTDLLTATYNWLDLTALGRQEDWESPPGRGDGPFMSWVRRHDEYGPDA
ncbi:DUF899 domain-containing protein [Microbispora amethystogenes]|uniref:DUF899 domain-containing protein n=1 Tax=Microbispora amethystogenes TaxID=1427754 RepID=UPI0033D6D848